MVARRHAVCDVVRNRRVRLVHPPDAKDTRGKATTKINPTKKKPKARATTAAKVSRLLTPLSEIHPPVRQGRQSSKLFGVPWGEWTLIDAARVGNHVLPPEPIADNDEARQSGRYSGPALPLKLARRWRTARLPISFEQMMSRSSVPRIGEKS